ncbi:MAG TPA: hypothetical protein VF669_15710 [Tepidisphaeraceae bacterium]
MATLQQLGLACAETDEPYSAMVELARRPLVYRTLVVSLASIFKEELAFIATVKRRMPHVEIWLTHTDGRAGTLAEAMRLGADGLLSDEGFHRTATGAAAPAAADEPTPGHALPEKMSDKLAATPDNLEDAPEPDLPEPVLSADELRALLQEQPNLEGEE